MLRFLAEYYGSLAVGPAAGQIFGIIVGAIFGLLLVSAVNTAIVALIGVIYMMAQDGEMPRQLARLNRHGVPKIPLFIAVGIPIVILAVTKQFEGSGRALRDRCRRRDRGQPRRLHLQQTPRPKVVRARRSWA